jgi:hypothetical protein
LEVIFVNSNIYSYIFPVSSSFFVLQGQCLCSPGYAGTKCQTTVAPANQYKWETTKWSSCSKNCGNDGTRERSSKCVKVLTNERVSNSFCSATVETFETCHRFDCDSVVGVGAITIIMPHSYVNTTSLHIATFEETVESELSSATNIPTSRFFVVNSTSYDGDLTSVRFLVLPPLASGGRTVEEIINDLNAQTLNAESKLRTDGSFIRRVVPKEGALNFLYVTAIAPSAISAGSDNSLTQIDQANPEVDINAPTSATTPSSGKSIGLNHGGIAGIVVACTFMGIGAIVGVSWFVCHKTSAGAKFKQNRGNKRSTMKIKLTEQEKIEMGTVNNPMNNNDEKVAEAIQMIQEAVKQDEGRNFGQAITLYQGAIDRYKIVMKNEKNPQYKFQLAKKMDRYMVRVKELKQYLKSRGGASGGRRGGQQLPSRQSDASSKSQSLVRAPQVISR